MICVLAFLLPHDDLLLRAHLRLYGEQGRRALVDRFRVVDREALLRAGDRDRRRRAAGRG